MKIEAGKYYRTRDGRKVGPMENFYTSFKAPGVFHFIPGGEGRSDHHQLWNNDGSVKWLMGKFEDVDTLVAEWTGEPPSPIRTRTVTEIVPGTYGRLTVTGTYKNRATLDWQQSNVSDAVSIVGLDAAELRAAATVFVQLAEALEGGAA